MNDIVSDDRDMVDNIVDYYELKNIRDMLKDYLKRLMVMV